MNDKNSNKSSRTDWDRLRKMPDEQVDTSDVPQLSRQFFENAELQLPRVWSEITLRLDSDVLAWFKAQGEDWQRRLNAALRIYAEAHPAYSDESESAA